MSREKPNQIDGTLHDANLGQLLQKLLNGNLCPADEQTVLREVKAQLGPMKLDVQANPTYSPGRVGFGC